MSEEKPAPPKVHYTRPGAYILLSCILMWMWIGGVVLAKGAWSCFFAITLPPYALYLVIERTMLLTGFITQGGM
jgi:uncharacterized membrane protein